MKKISCLLITIVIMLNFVSCNQTESSPRVEVGCRNVVYNDIVYYLDSSALEIKYQNINNIQDTGLSLYGDALLTSEENPFWGVFDFRVLIDQNATQKNDGFPILYMYLRKIGSNNQIVSFDTKTNRVQILKDNLTNMDKFYLYGDYIVFSNTDVDSGYIIHTMKIDGKDYRTLENPEKLGFRVRNIHNDLIYFTDDMHNLYSAPLTLDSYTRITDNCSLGVFFGENEIYYIEWSTGNLCKNSLSGDSEKEIVLEQKVSGITDDSRLLYVIMEPNDTQTIYLYDPNTDFNGCVYQNLDSSRSVSYRAFSDKYILFYVNAPEKDYLLYYDIALQKETVIPF